MGSSEQENAVTYPSLSEEDPGQAIVFGDGFYVRTVAHALRLPAIALTTRRMPIIRHPYHGAAIGTLHTGSMTRASVLDAVEPEAVVHCTQNLRKLGVEAGGMSTYKKGVLVMARADRRRTWCLPFAYVEAAANILTNPAVDPYGKIPI